MQSLEIISINLWQVVISLCNLLLLFLLFKKFLYKPVKNAIAKRESAINDLYNEADEAKQSAINDKEAWENKMRSAEDEADGIIKNAAMTAQRRGDAIVNDAKERADGIVRQAEAQAELELEKAAAGIKKEIVGVSAALTEKMLSREIRAEDHRALIDSFLEEIGDSDDADK